MELKKKYNDFINIIDEQPNTTLIKKEIINNKKLESSLLSPTIKNDSNFEILPKSTVNNQTTNSDIINKDCNCYTSTSDSDDFINENIVNNKIYNFQNSSFNNENIIEKDNEHVIENNNIIKKDNEHGIENDKNIIEESENSINEFDMIFDNRFNILENNDLNTMNKQMNNLEAIFNKIVEKKTKDDNNDKNKKNNNLLKGDILKNLCLDIEEKIFLESTRGYNIKENIFKIRIDKLKEKLQNYDVPIFYTIGYIYRDFNNSKSFINENINELWLDINKKDGKIHENYLKPRSKFLQACLKNLANNDKFKKKINDENIRAFKKTIQIDKNELIIDIVFYVKYKINNTNI